VFENTGGIVIAGAVNTSGGLKLTAHSPITVNSSGSINAVGDVVLTAGSAGSAAPGDSITINGTVKGKSVMLSANRVAGNIPSGAIINVAVTTSVPAPTVIDTLTSVLSAYSTASVVPPAFQVAAAPLTTADVMTSGSSASGSTTSGSTTSGSTKAGTDSKSANEKKEDAEIATSAETPAKIAEAPTAKPIPVCR
jgi:hypothetical protein